MSLNHFYNEIYRPTLLTIFCAAAETEKALSFQDGPTGGTSFVNICQNVCIDP